MKIKKNLSLILSALMLSVPLSSCSNSSSDTDANSPESDFTADMTESETEEELSDGLGDPDFGGYSFRIMSPYFGGEQGANRIMYDEITGNPVNDALYESKIYIEDRFKVKYESIEITEASDVQISTKTSINAGDDAFDIVINHDGMTFDLAKEGLFYNMRNVEQFNFDMPWWPEKTVESLSLCGKLYCASSYISYLGMHWTRAVIVNKDYADELNLEIPYDMVREGKWTADVLLSMVEGNSQDLDGNGKMTAADKVAFVTGTQTYYCLQESMDIPIYRHGENGVPYLDIDVDKIDTMFRSGEVL